MRDFPWLQDWLRREQTTLIVVLGLFFITAALWFPFEINRPETGDSWNRLVVVERDLNNNIERLVFDRDRTRAFTHHIWVLAYWLSPDSLIGANLLQIPLIALSAIFIYGVIRRLLPNSPKWIPFFVAVLTIVYPGDLHQFYMGAIAGRLGILLYWLAFYLLLDYRQRPRLLKLVLMGLALTWTMLINERVYPLVGVSPLALLWLERRFSRRIMIPSLVWYAITAIFSLRFVVAVATNTAGGRVDALTEDGRFLLSGDAIGQMFGKLTNAVRYLFSEAWISESSLTLPMLLTALLIAGGSLLILLWLRRGDAPEISTTNEMNWRQYARWFVVGLAVILLGYLPFAVIEFGPYIHTLYMSVTGAAICLLIILYVIDRMLQARGIFVFVAGTIIIGFATLVSLDMHQQQVMSARRVGNTFTQIIEQAGVPDRFTGFMIFNRVHDGDRLAFIDETFLNTEGFASNGLRYITDVRYYFCVYPEGLSKPGCAIEGDMVTFFNLGEDTIPFSEVIAFEFQEDGSLTLLESIPEAYLPDGADTSGYHPQTLIRDRRPPDSRIDTVLGDYPKPILE